MTSAPAHSLGSNSVLSTRPPLPSSSRCEATAAPPPKRQRNHNYSKEGSELRLCRKWCTSGSDVGPDRLFRWFSALSSSLANYGLCEFRGTGTPCRLMGRIKGPGAELCSTRLRRWPSLRPLRLSVTGVGKTAEGASWLCPQLPPALQKPPEQLLWKKKKAGFVFVCFLRRERIFAGVVGVTSVINPVISAPLVST